MERSGRPTALVLVVAYRSDDHLAACLGDLDAADVVVIDNGASDTTRGIVEAAGARYLSAPGNIGFAAAVNLGLAKAWDGERDVLLLNPDARLNAGDVAELQAALHAPGERRAAVGPRLVGFDGASQRASWPMPSPWQVWLDAFGLSRWWRGKRFVVGAALLLNGAALAEIGQLDERYFLYAEETDWQLRAQRAGWTVAVVDAVTARHVGAASSADDTLRNELFHASGEKFARRWYGAVGWQLLRFGALFAAARRSFVGRPANRRLNRRTFQLYLRGPASRESAGQSVVHVVRSDGFAGVERYIVDTAVELAARGWRVSVIGGRPSVMPAELGAGINYRPARTTWQVLRALRGLGANDVVHAHMTAAELPAALLKRRLGARLIVTRHFATPRGRSTPGRIAAGVIERRMDLQLAISAFVADATPSPCVVVHNGVRESDQDARRERVVVMLQRLEPEKDTATALRAWAASGLAAQDWRLVVCGTGSAKDALRALAADLGIEDTVTFAGFVDDPRAALRNAEIMLATATAEPFGLAVVEAMAEGTPVVATRAGAHPETLGDDGVYFAPGDGDGCAAQLVRLAKSDGERRAIGDRLRDRQRAMFSIAAHVDQLETLYREQLAKRPEREPVRG